MRVDRLSVKNFRGFADRSFEFHRATPKDDMHQNGSFHLLIGDNATGKTGVLEALSVALGSFTNVMPDAGKRHFWNRDVRVELQTVEDTERIEPQLPTEVSAEGMSEGRLLKWTRRLRNKRVERAPDRQMREYAQDLLARGRKDPRVIVPVVCYFGTERLHSHPRDVWSRDASIGETLVPKPDRKTPAGLLVYSSEKFGQSRFVGYWYANDARTSPELMQRWLMVEHDLNRDRGYEATQFTVVKDAMRQCIVDCDAIKVDARLGLLVKLKHQGWLPFDLLSDGQKVIAATVGELAWKAAQLNPTLGVGVLSRTPGVVLIDEIDLHLHPKWQRKIVQSLRSVFPEVQFIATTHSPVVVQSMHEGEVQQLDISMGSIAVTENQNLETITKGLMVPPDASIDEVTQLMGVADPQTSERYGEMKDVAKRLLALLDQVKTANPEKREGLKDEIAGVMQQVKSYSDNPAFQAFLEMRRVAAFGE